MKFLYSFILLLAVIGASQGFSFTWGKLGDYDYLLSSSTEVRSPLKNNLWTITDIFPRAGTNNFYIISAIKIIDNFRNNSGASPNLLSGGPGYRHSIVELRSQINRGLNSTIEIYGY